MKNWLIPVVFIALLFLKPKKKNLPEMRSTLRTPEQRQNYDFAKRFLSERFSPEIVKYMLRQIKAESSFRANAKSPAGAMGLTQFMPATWKDYGEGGNPYNVEDSLMAYIRFMTMLNERFPNRPDIVLAAYNWGQNRRVLRNAHAKGEKWQSLKNKLPKETIDYVEKILMK